MSPRRRILVTSALPYANGPVHLGHIIEATQTDIWVRLHKMLGHECYYVCAEDTHGTPVMLRAEQEGIAPEKLIERMAAEHLRDYTDFGIGLDYFHSTHSPENRRFVETIYQRLSEGGHITRRSVRQFYDPLREIFLPDRFVKGTCPRCGSPNQNGDSCDNCGATYTPRDLVDPISSLSGAVPVERDSEHLFLQLSDFEELLRAWIREPGRLQPEVVNKLDEWLVEGLQDWDISRESPYFGFEIPDAPGKHFYVWVDAPIGYMASFEMLAEQLGLRFDDFWGKDSDAELYHFIGKDILYFHCIFWPALLAGGGYRLPTSVPVHGFLTVDGTKMSKSRGTFVTARAYLDHLPAEALRYYFAAKLGPGLGDIDLNLEDFVQRVNSDLVGKVVNIASRCAGFLQRLFDGRLAPALDQPELLGRCAAEAEAIAEHFAQRDYNRAVRAIMALADEANRYIDERKPWVLARDEAQRESLHQVLTTGINLFRVLITYLKPVIPATAERAETFLRIEPLRWTDAALPLLDHAIAPYEPLMTRVEPASAAAMQEASKPQDTPPVAAPPADLEPITDEITLDDFAKVDLRVAKVLEASAVEGADKLLRLHVDLGDHERTIFAGIRRSYEPADLVGRFVVVVANLKARKMRFGVSEGMALAAADGQGDPETVFLLAVDAGAQPGQRIR
jgi:methionyl-tRNA synthetase